MNRRGRKRRITESDKSNLEKAVRLMKLRKSGGAKAKRKHCEMILAYIGALAELNADPSNPSKVAAYNKKSDLIGSDVAALIDWIPEGTSVKTLENYKSIDPIRYVPTWLKKCLESLAPCERKTLNDDLTVHAKHEEYKSARKKRKPTTLSGILAQQRKEQGRS